MTARRRGRVVAAVVAVVATIAAVGVGAGAAAPAVVEVLVRTVVVAAVATAIWLSPAGTRRRATRLASVALGVVAASLVGAAAVGALQARAGLDELHRGLDAAADGERDQAVAHFEAAGRSLETSRASFGAWWAAPGRLVPLAGRHLDAAASLASSATGLASSGSSTSAQVDLTAIVASRGRFDLDQLARLQPPLAGAAGELQRTATAIDGIDRDGLLPPMVTLLAEVEAEVGAARRDAETAATGARLAPAMLGADGARRYLVIFGSPSEARELGGFMGAGAILVADAGRVSIERTLRADELNAVATGPPLADGYPERYRRYQPERYWQNVTGTPDFPTVARAASELLPASGGPDVAGVIYADPYALAAMLSITGPVFVPEAGQELTADNAAAVLLREQYVQFASKGGRVEFLAQAATATFQRLISGEVPGPRRVARVLGPMVEQRRLMLVAHAPEEAAFLDRLGLTGAMPGPDGGDLLSVVHANANPSKIDAFLHRHIDHDAAYDPATGEVSATTTIALRNDAPAAGLPDYVIGSSGLDLPRGTNHLLLSVYTPLSVTDATVDGIPVSFERSDEFGLGRYSAYVDVPPGATATVVVQLDGRVRPDPTYRLTVVGQPAVSPDELTLRVQPASAGPATDDELDGTRHPCRRQVRLAGGRLSFSDDIRLCR